MSNKIASNISAVLSFSAAVFIISGCSQSVINPVSSPPAIPNGDIVINVASSNSQNEAIPSTAIDPYDAGKNAAELLKKKMGNNPCHTVIIAEFFEDKSAKSKALKGVCSVFDSSIVYGFATYGSFGQDGCSDGDSIRLVGIGGNGISVAAALQQNLGTAGLTMEDDAPLLQQRLQAAGTAIADKLPKSKDDKLMILIPDAHSPKNAHVVEGAQVTLGTDFPITGGSPNKNPGQTYIYYQGKIFSDCAIAFMLAGDFKVSLAGRKAKENSKVISSAGQGFAESLNNLNAKPLAAFAFNCAGRKGKLDNLEDELKAIQKEIGTNTPIFGTYCAGEIGPADTADKNKEILSSGQGWHLMVTMLGK